MWGWMGQVFNNGVRFGISVTFEYDVHWGAQVPTGGLLRCMRLVSGRSAEAELGGVSGELLVASPDSGFEDNTSISTCLASGSPSMYDGFPHFLLGVSS